MPRNSNTNNGGWNALRENNPTVDLVRVVDTSRCFREFFALLS
jgi:hypothetical protein